MLADQVDYVVGVDTHRDEHVLAVVVAPTGAIVAQRSVRATARGYAQALRFTQEHAAGARVWAVEGAGHYGAGLARYLSDHGETVCEPAAAHATSAGCAAKTIRLTPPVRPARPWRARRSACRRQGSDGRRCGYCFSPVAVRSTSAGRRSCSCAA